MTKTQPCISNCTSGDNFRWFITGWSGTVRLWLIRFWVDANIILGLSYLGFFFVTCCPTRCPTRCPPQCPSQSDPGSFSSRHIFLMMRVAALIMRSGNHSTQPACVECSPGEAFALKQLCLVMLYSYFTQVTTLTCWVVYSMVFEGGWHLWLCFSELLWSQPPPPLPDVKLGRPEGFWLLNHLISMVCLEFISHKHPALTLFSDTLVGSFHLAEGTGFPKYSVNIPKHQNFGHILLIQCFFNLIVTERTKSMNEQVGYAFNKNLKQLKQNFLVKF